MALGSLTEVQNQLLIAKDIGYLSKEDFEKALKNINSSLNSGGIYIFDIFNLEFMKNNFITYEFLDTTKEVNDTKFVRFNHNKLNLKKGLMSMNQKTYIQKGIDKPSITKESWDMQIYTAEQLKGILERNGFKIISFSGFDGSKFDREKSNFILTTAQKK